MAQFKYVGHEQGVDTPAGGLITIRGLKNAFNGGEEDNRFELQVEPGEIFEIPDSWETAVQSLELKKSPTDSSKLLYERVS